MDDLLSAFDRCLCPPPDRGTKRTGSSLQQSDSKRRLVEDVSSVLGENVGAVDSRAKLRRKAYPIEAASAFGEKASSFRRQFVATNGSPYGWATAFIEQEYDVTKATSAERFKKIELEVRAAKKQEKKHEPNGEGG